MRLNSQLAVISICHDLTDPDSESTPLATLLVADSADKWLAAIAVIGALKEFPPGLFRDMLYDTPTFLESEVNAAFREMSSDSKSEQVIARIQNSLRSTVHVSMVADADECDVPEEDIDEIPLELVTMVVSGVSLFPPPGAEIQLLKYWSTNKNLDG